MRILQIILFEYILGYLLQGFSNYIGIYALCKRKIEIKEYIFASLIITVVFFLMRLLPISFGIHAILNAIFIFLIGILYLGLQPLNTIIALLLINIILLGTEFANVIVFMSILGKARFDALMNDSLSRYILGFPTSIIFALLNFLSYYFLVIKKRKKSVAHGENCARYI